MGAIAFPNASTNLIYRHRAAEYAGGPSVPQFQPRRRWSISEALIAAAICAARPAAPHRATLVPRGCARARARDHPERLCCGQTSLQGADPQEHTTRRRRWRRAGTRREARSRAGTTATTRGRATGAPATPRAAPARDGEGQLDRSRLLTMRRHATFLAFDPRTRVFARRRRRRGARRRARGAHPLRRPDGSLGGVHG